jgi:two-component system response regulator FixJ
MAADRLIYVVDDDEGVRDSLQILLESIGHSVRVFASGIDFLAALPDLPAGCAIIDVRMPEIDGLELQQRLAEQKRRLPVIVMTGHGDVAMAVRAMKAGAVDFVEKPFSDDAIFASVQVALDRLDEHPRDDGATVAAGRIATLSPREREVLDGLVAGLPNKTIAYDLAISPRTVEIHRARVMDKMQARSLSELVRLALAAGIDPKPRE